MDVTQEIEVPDYVKDVCTHWHDGQASLMYSVCSTGKIQYQRLFQLLNDMPHVGDDPDATETENTQLRNSRAWINSFLDDNYFETLDEALIQDEEKYSLS